MPSPYKWSQSVASAWKEKYSSMHAIGARTTGAIPATVKWTIEQSKIARFCLVLFVGAYFFDTLSFVDLSEKLSFYALPRASTK